MNWLDIIQTLAIVMTLILSIVTNKYNIKQTKLNNRLTINSSHREIWTFYIDHFDELKRIFEKQPDINTKPITDNERFFVNMVLLHANVSLKANNAKTIYQIDGLKRDIQNFLSFAIPREVWKANFSVLDKDFIAFCHSNVENL